MSIEAVLSGDMRWWVEHGDNRVVMPQMPDACLDAIVTDPPYGLSSTAPDMAEIFAHWLAGDDGKVGEGLKGFMSRSWDSFVPGPATWKEHYRLLKPGGHMFVFGGTRTYDLLMLAIRLAGFEIRDCLQWWFAEGMPKSMSVSKAIDKAAGAEREVVGYDESRARPNRKYASGAIGNIGGNENISDRTDNGATITKAATDAAKQWEGWGTNLKPCYEPVVVARKPLIGTVVANVLKHGTGALHIDACRVGFASKADEAESKGKNQHGDSDNDSPKTVNSYGDFASRPSYNATGRWPSNILLQHSSGCVKSWLRKVRGDARGATDYDVGRRSSGFGDVGADSGDGVPNGRVFGDADGNETVDNWACADGCPVAELNRQSGVTTSGAMKREVPSYDGESNTGFLRGRSSPSNQHGDTGGASRFFNTFESDPDDVSTASFIYMAKASSDDRHAGFKEGEQGNTHNTVKSSPLMRHLVKLGCPPGGIVGDFFSGSGSTGRGAMLEGFRFIGCELNDTEKEPYVTIARRRIAHAEAERERELNTPKQQALFETVEPKPVAPPKAKQGGLFDG